MLSTLTRIVVPTFLLAAIVTSQESVFVPNFPDLTIKTRHTIGQNPTFLTTSYFKGPRQRMEIRQESEPHLGGVTIMQCDQDTLYILDEHRKTYLKKSVDNEFSGRAHGGPTPSIETVDVTVTIDSVDTGERRQVGSYSARHVRTTTTIDPSEEAGTQASEMVTDGWYLDLPGWNCREDASQKAGILVAGTGKHTPHYIFRRLGLARRGPVIEETTITTRKDFTSTIKTEFVEISEAPLDPALFEVPVNYKRITQPAER